MAKKKKDDPAGAAAVFLMQLLGAIVLLLSMLAIVALLGAWVYLEFAIRRYPNVKGRADFRLTTEERQELTKYIKAGKRIQARISEINDLKSVLPLRTDGNFDSRNTEGRALNSELQALRVELESCERTVDHLSNMEESTYQRWAKIRSALLASRLTVISIPVTFVALHSNNPQYLSEVSAFFERTTGLSSFMEVNQFYGILSITAGTSLAGFMILWGLFRLMIAISSWNSD